jgi:hypothetical protein
MWSLRCLFAGAIGITKLFDWEPSNFRPSDDSVHLLVERWSTRRAVLVEVARGLTCVYEDDRLWPTPRCCLTQLC